MAEVAVRAVTGGISQETISTASLYLCKENTYVWSKLLLRLMWLTSTPGPENKAPYAFKRINYCHHIMLNLALGTKEQGLKVVCRWFFVLVFI